MHHYLLAVARCLAMVIVFFSSLTVAQAQSQTPPAIVKGVQWLSGQVQADGSLLNQAQAIATPLQARSELLQTLRLLASVPIALSASIEAEQDQNTEYLARMIISKASMGADASSLSTKLIATANSDGGYGGAQGYVSTAFDTAISLIALKMANQAAGVPAAMNYLQSSQQADGAFLLNGRSDVYTSIYALAAFRVYASSMALINPIKLSSSYLMAQQSAPGMWNNSVFYTALAYPILHDFIPLAPTASAVSGFLQTTQQADGSWGADPYVTALALRALTLSNVAPADPSLAQIQGRLLDAQTHLPLSGVLVSDANGVSITSDMTGTFLIQNLKLGSHQISLIFPQYQTLNTTFSVQAGQLLDLGDLLMTKGVGATTGTLFGTIIDAASKLPLSGVSIFINDIESGVTDAKGAYQVSNVVVGSVTLRASKNGYTSTGSSGIISAGNALIFSPVLTSINGDPTGASMQGVVVRASDNSRLGGVSISVTGSSSISTVTNAMGQYNLSGLASGTVQITASIAGYDTVVANAQVTKNTVITFSPKMYLASTTPNGQNAAGVQGIIMDASNNMALSGVEIIASVIGQPDSKVTTGTNGRFNFAGITESTVTLKANLASYASSLLQVPLQPLQILDVGQIRLRKNKTTQLLSDLQVSSASRTLAITDPQSLTLSGKVVAAIANIGTAPVATNFEVLAFYDTNGNGKYDESIDIVLGRGVSVGGLATASSQIISIPVAGKLPFRDAPIHVWADSKNAVIESDKTNNVRSTAFATELIPNIAGFDPVLKWQWTDSEVLPSSVHVVMTPVVAPLYDTNGDGYINQNDIPSVAFVSFEGESSNGTFGVLRIIGGKDGKEILTVSDPKFRLESYSNLAIADIDGSGHPVIIGLRYRGEGGGIIAFNADGSVRWVSPKTFIDTNFNYTWGGVSIADLDGDGKAEIIYGNQVFNYDGSLRWTGAANYIGSNIYAPWRLSMSLSVVADINKDGNPVVLAGPSAYDKNGTLLWKNDAIEDGFVAVANVTGDPYPEIVVVSNSSVYLLDRKGAIIWGPVAIPGGGRGGAPTIADMDGDGIPEIGVAGANQYTAFRADGSVFWTSITRDYSSGVTGSTVFDFEGDGRSEVLYGDEETLRIYNGQDGKVLFSIPNSTGTALEYPVVVDVDNDGHADFLVAAHTYTANIHGIRAFQGRNNDWVNTRAIWNQHSYHITNINDDGSVPKVEENSWDKANTYRANRSTRLYSCVAPVVLFDETFTQTPSPVWSALNGRGANLGSIINGQYQRTGAGASVAGDAAWSDYVAEMKLQFPNGVTDDAGLAFRVKNSEQWYGLSVRENSLNLVQYNQGKFTILQQTPIQLPADASLIHSLKIEVVGTTVKGYLNNVQLMNYSGIEWLQGSVGTQQGNVTALYSAVKVSSYAPPFSRDVSASNLRVIDGGTLTSKLTIRIGNSGSLSLPLSVPVSFYGIDVVSGMKKLLGTVYTKTVMQSGQYEDLDFAFADLSSISRLMVSANDDGNGTSLFQECDSNNNAVSMILSAMPGTFGISVASDQSSYVANSNVKISAGVNNRGSFANSAQVQFQIQTPQGVVVASLPSQTLQIEKGAQANANAVWNTGSTIAGNYQVVAQLIDTNGAAYAQASSAFSIGSGNSVAQVKVSTDKTSYLPGDTVQLHDLLSNLAQNQALNDVQVSITVLNPDGSLRFNKTESLAQLPSASSKEYNYSLPLNVAPAGVYIVKVSATAGALNLGQASSSFTVISSSNNGTGLSGTISATPSQVAAGSTLVLNFSAKNLGNSALANLPLSVSILDPVTQTVLAQFPYTSTMEIGASFANAANWIATGKSSGTYVATLSAIIAGKSLNLAQTNFTVIVPQVNIIANVDRDKASYSPCDTLHVYDGVFNQNATAMVNKLQIVVTVKNPDNTVRFTKTESLSQLAGNGMKTYDYIFPLTSAPVGQYMITIVVTDTVTGNTVARNSMSFAVTSSASTGCGLTGSITATPGQVALGSELTLTSNASNLGNAELKDLPLTVTIQETLSKKVVAQFPNTISLPVSGVFVVNNTWVSAGTVGMNYLAVLSAKVGASQIALAQAAFSLIAPVIKLDITQAPAPWQNVLVYAACERQADQLLGLCGSTPFPLENAASLAQCDKNSAALLDKTLTGLGVAHTITSSSASFIKNLRSGLFNTYWISNGATVLREPLSAEIIAAIQRGDSVMIDGLSKASNLPLTQCAQVANVRKYPTPLQELSLNAGIYHRADLPVPGLPVQLTAIGGVQEASLLANGGVTPGIVSSHTVPGVPGAGNTLAFAFDWSTTLGSPASDARWPGVLQQSLNFLTPAVSDIANLLSGEVGTLNTTLHNTGKTLNLRVVQSLPVGASVLASTPPATVSSTATAVTASWDLSAQTNADTLLSLRWKAPLLAGAYSASVAVNILDAGLSTPYKTQSIEFQVQDAQQLNAQLIESVRAQPLSAADQLAQQSAILAMLEQATAALSSRSMESALRILLTVQTRLKHLEQGTGPLMLSLSALIGAVERQTPQ